MADVAGRPARFAVPLPGAAESRALRWVTPAAYLSLAVLFITFYTVRTVWMQPQGIQGLTYSPPFPFRYRVLSPFIAALLTRGTGVQLEWIYAAQGTLCVWGALLFFRRVLAGWMRADLARVLAPGLLYGMVWQYCAMNRLHFPFDMPAVFFFVAGWWCLLEQRWRLYYALFPLAVLNRETCLLLTLTCAAVWFRRMPGRTLALHLGAQVAIWLGLKTALWFAYPCPGNGLFIDSLAKNRDALLQVLTMRGDGPLIATKFLLWCGGLWAPLPFILRGQPEPIRRSLLVIGPFFAGLVFVGTLREMRVYGELIPLVTAPCLIWLARQLEPQAAATVAA